VRRSWAKSCHARCRCALLFDVVGGTGLPLALVTLSALIYSCLPAVCKLTLGPLVGALEPCPWLQRAVYRCLLAQDARGGGCRGECGADCVHPVQPGRLQPVSPL
jgi:hypothetical protein